MAINDPAMIGILLVALAMVGGKPRKSNSGSVTVDPLLAKALIKPLRIPAAINMAISKRDGIG